LLITSHEQAITAMQKLLQTALENSHKEHMEVLKLSRSATATGGGGDFSGGSSPSTSGGGLSSSGDGAKELIQALEVTFKADMEVARERYNTITLKLSGQISSLESKSSEMVSSHRDKIEEDAKKISKLEAEIAELQKNSGKHVSFASPSSSSASSSSSSGDIEHTSRNGKKVSYTRGTSTGGSSYSGSSSGGSSNYTPYYGGYSRYNAPRQAPLVLRREGNFDFKDYKSSSAQTDSSLASSTRSSPAIKLPEPEKEVGRSKAYDREVSDDLPFNFAVKASGSVVLLSILFIGISYAAGSAALAACSMALGAGGLGVFGVEFYKHSKRQEVLDNAVEDRNQLRAKGIDPDLTVDDLINGEVKEEEHKSDSALKSSASTTMLHKYVLERRDLEEKMQSRV